LARRTPKGVLKLLSAHDSLRLRFLDLANYAPSFVQRLRARILASLAQRFERQWYRNFDQIVVTSDLDRLAIQELVQGVPVGVLPNGVNLEFFRFAPNPKRGQLVFTGNMSWPPNEDAACHFSQAILPRIRVSRDDVTLSLVGADPSPRVRALDRAPGVTVTGTVEDIRPWVWSAELFVCPLRFGAGVKNKVLEAMSLGAPVVGTPRSFTGTPIQAGKQACLAQGPEEFASVVLTLLADHRKRYELALEARKLVETSYSWDSVARMLEQYYEARLEHTAQTAGHDHPSVVS
jgi:glycosyltransferase involved in cell wall biosynthesis